MLTPFIDNFSQFIGISNTIIPNVVTFIIVAFLLVLGLKGQATWATLLIIYGVAMVALDLLGIDSVFNLISMFKRYLAGGN